MSGVGTTHHISLGGHFYLLKPGSYWKSVAPQFGARFTTGDPDWNNLSIWQHWAQRCFIGGMDQTEWSDDAMYDDGVGVNTSEHEKVTLARDLSRGSGSNWAVTASRTRKFIVYNNILYVLETTAAGTAGKLWKYDPSTDGWSAISAVTTLSAAWRSIGTFDGKLWISGLPTAGGASKLYYSTGALSSWTLLANPSGVTAAVYAMRSFQQKFYLAFGTQIWRLKNDLTYDGTTVFYKADLNSESNWIAEFEPHLGFLYFISQNGHVHRTDGNSSFDIWSWDGQTTCTGIKSFDGSLFVSTYEYTNTTDEGYGVLYKMSGSAMTQLKRWGKDGESTSLGRLTVYDRHLFYGAGNLLGMRAGFGVAVYDPIEDAHSVIASNGDTATYLRGSAPYADDAVEDVIFFQGKLFCSVRQHGIFYTLYRYRDLPRSTRTFDTTSAGGSFGSMNGGYLTTSTYDAGTPGLKKLWRKVIIDYLLPSSSTGMTIEYSTNGGTSYTSLGNLTTSSTGVVAGTRGRFEYWLQNITSVSFKLRITLRSTSTTVSPVLYGFVVSYIPSTEPNWMWTFTIVLSAEQALLDGTVATVDTESELSFLDNLYRTKDLVTFIDAEGQTWASNGPGALIYDMRVWLPDLVQPLEGEVQVTLVEAVETY